ncbi:MAG: tetratricopeptide repeat protein [Candidatus Cloacimonetes bacterium]|jgi:tetratricopeptide (TPR) repeat protein|nr:tetratricopeptide repeat protein [Candidatus Cloacimonadota bacterium]MDD4155063.1 tetratricopeptide repeat protein [Candidatus Cloacimonadota bacterium]
MKKIFFIVLVLIGVNLFASVKINDIFLEYNSDPNFESFTKAYNFLNISADYDTTMSPYVSYLYLSLLHKNEYNRMLELLMSNVDYMNSQMKFQIANLLLDDSKYDEAINLYNQVTDDIPDWSCAWRHKGKALLMIKDYNNAEKALEKSIETREGHYDAYLNLAEVYYAQKKYKDAKRIIEQGFQYQAIDVKDEDDYSIEYVHFLYLDILRASKDKNTKNFESEVRSKFPDSQYWDKK